MFRGRRQLSGCIGKVCRRSCASWEFVGRDESRSGKSRVAGGKKEKKKAPGDGFGGGGGGRGERRSGKSRVAGENTETKIAQGYVLAGGGSTRFGRDKALVEIDGKAMLLRMRDL